MEQQQQQQQQPIIAHENGDNMNNVVVNALNFPRLVTPTFMPEEIDNWFYLLESYFAASNILSDQTKFDTVRSQFPISRLRELRPLAEASMQQPRGTRYEHLKANLLNVLQESQQRRLRQILEDMPLGDKKPSQLYHDLVYSAQNAISESALLDLWYTRLPESVASSAMITNTSTLDKLRMADVTYDNWQLRNSSSSKSASVFKINSKKTGDTQTDLQDMFQQFNNWMLNNGNVRNSRSRERSRSRSRQYQPRTNSQNSRRNDHSIEQFNDCWYHRTFGIKATNCKKPCSFQNHRNSSSILPSQP